MRIGIVTVWADCGAGYVSRAYAEVLSERYPVMIYARGTHLSGRGDPFWDTPNVVWDTSMYGITHLNLCQYIGWLKKNRIDLVIFNEQRWWQAVIATRQLGVATACYVDYYTSETLPLFKLYDVLLCNTQRHFSVFKHHPQAYYIPWGTNTSVFVPGSRWRKKQDEVIFFHSAGMGGTNDRKGTGVLLKAFHKIKGPVRLIIHSQVSLQNLPQDWQHFVKSNPNIQVLEGTVKPPGCYSLGDVYVYPTRLEGIGLSLPEALSCGLPAITTNQPPMNEFVHENVNGALVDTEEYLGRFDGYYWPETPCPLDPLVSCMQYYVDHPDLITDLQSKTRQYAVSKLDWSKNSSNLPEILESICGKRKDEELDLKLIKLANHIDTNHEPTPFQLVKRAARLSLQQLKSELAFLFPEGRQS